MRRHDANTLRQGQCKGSSVGKEIKSWIDDHKGVVIGIAAGVGGLILLLILGCVYRCFRRRKDRKRFAARNKVASTGSWVGGGMPGGPRGSRSQMAMASPPPPLGQMPPPYQPGGYQPQPGGWSPQSPGRGSMRMSGGNGQRGMGGGGWDGPMPPPSFQSMPPPAFTRGQSVRYA